MITEATFHMDAEIGSSFPFKEYSTQCKSLAEI